MKRITKLLVLTLCLVWLFASCSDDKDDPAPDKISLLGTWELISAKGTITHPDGHKENWTDTESPYNSRFEFKANHVLVVSIKYNNQWISQTTSWSTFTDKIDGEMLHIDEDDYYFIKSLTKDTLILTYGVEEGDREITYEDGELIYKRIN